MDRKLDYYGLLGLDRKATLGEIRAAFRSLALKFHPDRKPDAESQHIFRQISEAYDALSDPETRKIYDQIGSEGLRSRAVRDCETDDYASVYGQRFRDDPRDLSTFGKDSPFGDFSRAGKGGRGANLRMDIEISVADGVFGIQKSVEIIREEVCGACGGSRGKPGSWPAWCHKCEGKGTVYVGTGIFHDQLGTCPACRGEGKRIVIACDGCHGAGTVKVKRVMEVLVPARTKDGARVLMPGEGDESYWGGPPGDLTIHIRVRKAGLA